GTGTGGGPDTDAGASTGGGPGAGTDTGAGVGTNPGAGTGTGPDAGTNTGPSASTSDPGTETGPSASTNTGPDAGTRPGAGADTAGPDAGTGDPGIGTAPEGGFDAGPDAGTGDPGTATDPADAPGAEPDPGGADPSTDARTDPEGARADTAAAAFDILYNRTAPALTRQAYLLTGRRALAQEAVEDAFRKAWARWPEVATDPDPVGWVRAAAYEYALSPWHQFRRAHKHPDKPPADPGDRILMDAVLALPPAHRRTVLLYDGVGLDLPDTAAETEASTPTAGGRLVNAHAELADRIPELAAAAPEKQSALLRERLGSLTPAVPLEPRSAAVVRATCEGRARLWTRAALGLTTVIAVAAAYTAATAPTEYLPPRAPGANVSGVPPHSGPQQLSDEGRQLHDKLLSDPAAGPARVSPKAE
ncbi:DNA-directed RNA polymerase sigma-70 factor, partial [Streptomyces sp. ISL-66]|uniref:DNA-directed RNA polymerase sigma-70 factor n=1 Tax=Streptomyces sp. ISL-66 TaxID=2819186 RepID=UPI001BE6402B